MAHEGAANTEQQSHGNQETKKPHTEGMILENPEEVRPLLPGIELPQRRPSTRWLWITDDQLDRIQRQDQDVAWDQSWTMGAGGVCVTSFGTLFSQGDTSQFYKSHPVAFVIFVVLAVVTLFVTLVNGINLVRHRGEASETIKKVKSQYEG